MAQKDRIADIVNLIRVEQKVNVSNLAKRYQVTTETIRRDLELLEKDGIVARTYGGAIAVQPPPVPSDYNGLSRTPKRKPSWVRSLPV